MKQPIIRDTKCIIGPVRLSYVHVFHKYSPDGNDEDGKYSAVLIIPKTEKETIKAIRQAIENAKQAGIASKWNGKEPKKFDLPLRDGDEQENDKNEAFRGCYYINAKASTRPGVVDREMNPITDEEEIYSGIYAMASVTFFCYDVSGNKGVACGLNNIMKVKDGERLGGRVSAESDFAGVDLNDDDEDDL